MITDEQLREQVAQADPAAGQRAPDVLGRVAADRRPRPVLRPLLLTAAAVIAMVLVGNAVIPQLLPAGQSDSVSTVTGQAAPESEAMTEQVPDSADRVESQQQAMIRTASIISGTQDPSASADQFLQAVESLGGQVLSQTVVTEGSGRTAIQTDSAMPTPYPTGPGVWLTVQVPADQYDQALAAARETGQVVRLEQSAEDVTAEVTDTDARVRALESSLARLRTLMDRAQSVSEVISVEEAISQRQADLDALRAQQRELRNQTQMARVSIALMSPSDAAAAVGQPPTGNSALRWTLGLALVAGLTIAGVWAMRRRHDGSRRVVRSDA